MEMSKILTTNGSYQWTDSSMLASSGGKVREDPQPNVLDLDEPDPTTSLLQGCPPDSSLGLMYVLLFAVNYSIYPSATSFWEYLDSTEMLDGIVKIVEARVMWMFGPISALAFPEENVTMEQIKHDVMGETREGYVLPLEQDMAAIAQFLDGAVLMTMVGPLADYLLTTGRYTDESLEESLPGIAMLRVVREVLGGSDSGGSGIPTVISDRADGDLDEGLDLHLSENWSNLSGDDVLLKRAIGPGFYAVPGVLSGTLPPGLDASSSVPLVIQGFTMNVGKNRSALRQMLVDVTGVWWRMYTGPDEGWSEWRSLEAPSVATADTPGLVKPDGKTITVDESGTVSAAGVDTTALAQDETFVTALAQNETFVEAMRNAIGLANTEKMGLIPQLPTS